MCMYICIISSYRLRVPPKISISPVRTCTRHQHRFMHQHQHQTARPFVQYTILTVNPLVRFSTYSSYTKAFLPTPPHALSSARKLK